MNTLFSTTSETIYKYFPKHLYISYTLVYYMGIVKMSKSKKSVQFISDDGVVYFTSVNYLLGLLNGRSKCGFINLKKFPIPISKNRFQESEIWDPNGLIDSRTVKGGVTLGNDGLSEKTQKMSKEKKSHTDKVVW